MMHGQKNIKKVCDMGSMNFGSWPDIIPWL